MLLRCTDLGSDLPNRNQKPTRKSSRDSEKAKLRKWDRAWRLLTRLQFLAGISLILSGVFGIYLLITDKSLWILAVSHAYGLIAIVAIDIQFGIFNLLGVRRPFLLSVAGALLGVSLQIGDILTAPMYGMTIAYFASYLFSLWAFNALLFTQTLVIVFGVVSQIQIRTMTEHGKYETDFSASRRQFLKAMIAFAAVVGIASAFSFLDNTKQTLPSNGNSGNGGNGSGSNSTGTGGGSGGSGAMPPGAVANINQVSPGSPYYFDYPMGYPNILMYQSDGKTLVALSLLCTHVCCQVNYDNSNPSAPQLFCPCHQSIFDQNGNVVQGPANVPLPTVSFTIDKNGWVIPTKLNGTSPCIM